MSTIGIGGAYICHRCGSIMATHEEHSTTAGCLVASQFVSVGPTIWASEEARKIIRYDRAVELLREIASYEPLSDSDGGFINTWSEIEAFLAEEPK